MLHNYRRISIIGSYLKEIYRPISKSQYKNNHHKEQPHSDPTLHRSTRYTMIFPNLFAKFAPLPDRGLIEILT